MLTNVCELTDHGDAQLLCCHLYLWHSHGFSSDFREKYFISHHEGTTEQKYEAEGTDWN